MRAASIIIDPATPDRLAGDLARALRESDIAADLIFAFYDSALDGAEIRRLVSERHPDAALIGGSSTGGVMDHRTPGGSGAAGLLLIEDPDGDYGTAARVFGDDPAAAAEEALRAALEDAQCAGELPELIWTYQAPGHEECVLAGLKRVVGDRCPIVGGSSANDGTDERWSQLSRDGLSHAAVVVCVLFPSHPVGYGFQGGYEPNGHAGRVTRIDGGQITKVEGPRRSRTILEIDHQPAAAVYNRWIGGKIGDDLLLEGGNILEKTTMSPLSVFSGCERGVDRFLLVHPKAVRADGALTTFAEVEEGSEIHCMRGDPGYLITRSGRVAAQARKRIEERPAAALVIFCGGCRNVLTTHAEELSACLQAELHDTPSLICFTFGEQGPVLGVNTHGNLMISTIVFGA